MHRLARQRHEREVKEHLEDGSAERDVINKVYSLVPFKDGKPVVAVDLDEVLGHFIPALCDFHNETYETDLTLADFHSYSFHEVWGGTSEESVKRVHAFFETHHFEHMSPVDGAFQTLKHFEPEVNFIIVTSRQHVIFHDTLVWLQKHFPSIFCDVRFGNHWGLSGKKISKPDMCKDIGAKMIIDDNIKYALQCSELDGFKCVLFDWKDSYKWSAYNDEDLPSNVHRVSSWEHVHQALGTLTSESL